MTKPLKVIFMGTPDFAASALKQLHESSHHEVIAVYSQPPRPKGRGHKLQPSPVQAYAELENIKVFTPISLKKAPEQEEFAALNADIAVVAAYGLILPKAVLQAPKYGCLNIHASLLPRWRGASPIQRAIWAGDEKSGVTIMQMDEGLDTGDMLLKEEMALNKDMSCSVLHDALADMGAQMIVKVLDQYAQHGQIKGEKQDDALTCYAPLLKKEDGDIDWSQSATQIDRQIRALNPWPGVRTQSAGKRFKIIEAQVSEAQSDSDARGLVLNKKGDIACGDKSVLRLIKIQPDGKKPMDFASALNGGYIEIGDHFE